MLPAPLPSEDDIASALMSGVSPLEHELLRPMIDASPLFFAQTFLKGPPQAPFRGQLLFSPYHYEWERLITTQKRYVIVASRGSGKSFLLTFVQTLWRLVTQPDNSGYIFSGTELAAQRMLEEVRLEIERNPLLRWLMPTGTSRKWTAAQIRTSNGHHVTAKGMLTRVRGLHPGWLLGDDFLTDEDGWSETKRRKTTDYYFSTLTNMVMPGGTIGAVGTPQHRQDTIGQLQRTKSYTSAVYPALDQQRQSTWPEVYSTKYLLAIKDEIGSVRFARERLCEPVADESSLFPKSLFFQGDIMQHQAVLGAPLTYWHGVGIKNFYAGIDLALSTSASADYWVLIVIGVDDAGNRWIVDISRDRGLSFSEQKARIVSYSRKYDVRRTTIESNAYQAVAANELRRATDLPIYSFTTTSQKHSLTDGLPSLRILLENGKYRIPRGDRHSVEMTDLLIDEANNFTWVGGQAKSVGGHDDTTMSLFLCEQGIRKGQRSRLLVEGHQDNPPPAPAPVATQVPPAVPQPPTVRAIMPEATRRSLMPQPTRSPGSGQGKVVLRNGVYVTVD